MRAFKKIKYAAILLSLCLVLSGCSIPGISGKSEDKDGDESNAEYTDDGATSQLTDKTFYIHHKDGTFEPVYFGQTNFDKGSTKTEVNTSRVMWFKEDYSKVPTLYEGEDLVYYSTSEFEEVFHFERFKDDGYSVGICGLQVTKTNRFTMSTKIDKNNTYPGSDADAILDLSNDTVTVEAIGGMLLRAPDADEMGYRDQSLMPTTECGTIRGLTQNTTYTVDVYDGTIKNQYNLKADVACFGAMETCKTNIYSFDSATLIKIPLPTYFNSGYYNIDGQGLFRYVKGASWDENTDFNIPNVMPDGSESYVELNKITPEEASNEVTSKFKIEGTGGAFLAKVTFTLKEGYESGVGDGLPDVTAVIETPSGANWRMEEQIDGSFAINFVAKEEGEYTIHYYNLSARSPHLEITPLGDSDDDDEEEEEEEENIDDEE